MLPVIGSKALRVRNYLDATIKAFLDITRTLGVDSPDKLTPDMIFHRPEYGPAKIYRDIHPRVENGDFLNDKIPDDYAEDWARTRAQHF